ncbi:hypothetical protein D3C76_1441970 [compost metagenome]
MGPEQRAVLAHPPALAFKAPLMHGGVQRPLRQAGGAVLIGVETGEMLAEDLGFLVALETPGAGVPTGDDARWVGHVDGVVDHRVDEQAKALFLVHEWDLGGVLKHLAGASVWTFLRSMEQVWRQENSSSLPPCGSELARDSGGSVCINAG